MFAERLTGDFRLNAQKIKLAVHPPTDMVTERSARLTAGGRRSFYGCNKQFLNVLAANSYYALLAASRSRPVDP